MNILKYDFSFPSSSLFLGKTMCGKTTLMKNILYKYRSNFSRVFVYCPIYNNDYEFMDQKYVLRDIEVLKKIIFKQYDLKKENKQQSILIILDDWIGSCDVRYDTIFHKLATCGRHCDITTFYISQFLNKIPPVIRDNFNYIFILSISKSSLDSINEYQDTYSKNEFFDLYRLIKEKPYHGLLIDNKKPYLTNDKGALICTIPFHCPKSKK
jgi:hypothetical protein